MNNIATLLQRLSLRPVSEPYQNDARGRGTEDPLPSDKGKNSGFDAVLSGLSQNSSLDQKAQNAAGPVVPRGASMTAESPAVATRADTSASSSSSMGSDGTKVTPSALRPADAEGSPAYGAGTVAAMRPQSRLALSLADAATKPQLPSLAGQETEVTASTAPPSPKITAMPLVTAGQGESAAADVSYPETTHAPAGDSMAVSMPDRDAPLNTLPVDETKSWAPPAASEAVPVVPTSGASEQIIPPAAETVASSEPKSANAGLSGALNSASSHELTAVAPKPGAQSAEDVAPEEQGSVAGHELTAVALTPGAQSVEDIAPAEEGSVTGYELAAVAPTPGAESAEDVAPEEQGSAATTRGESSAEALIPVVPVTTTFSAENVPTIAAADEANGSTVLSADETIRHHSGQAGDPQGRTSSAGTRHADHVENAAEATDGGAGIVDVAASAALAAVAPSVQNDRADAEPAATDAAMMSGVGGSTVSVAAQGGERSAGISAPASLRSDRDEKTDEVPADAAVLEQATLATATVGVAPDLVGAITLPIEGSGSQPAVQTGEPVTRVPPAVTGAADNLEKTEVVGASAVLNSSVEAPRRRSASSGEQAAGTSAVIVQSTDASDAAVAALENAGSTDPATLSDSAALAASNMSPSSPVAEPVAVGGSAVESVARPTQMGAQRQEGAERALASTPPTAALDAAQASIVSEVNSDGGGYSAAMTATVVSSATHFAPVARLSPVQQIADAVIGLLPPLAPASSHAAAIADASGTTSGVASPDPTMIVAQPSAPAVQVLNLQLEPNNLGVVTITLNLSANGLDVQMAASHPATMDLIEKDKQALTDQLRQSGYSVAGLAVSHGGANVAGGGSATQNQGSQNAPSGGDQTMSHGGSSNGNNSSQSGAQNGLDRGANRQEAFGGAAAGSAGSTAREPLPGDLYI